MLKRFFKFINEHYWTIIAFLFLFVLFASGIITHNSQAALTREGSSSSYITYSATAVAATGANSSDSFPAAPFTQGTFQIVWAGHNLVNGSTFELQSSVNGTNWDTISGSSVSSSGTTGSTSIDFSSLPGDVIRVTLTNTSIAGSTITPYFIGKVGK